MFEALDFDDDGVLLEVRLHLGVEDELALLFGEVGGEDDCFLDCVEDFVHFVVFGLGEDGSYTCFAARPLEVSFDWVYILHNSEDCYCVPCAGEVLNCLGARPDGRAVRPLSRPTDRTAVLSDRFDIFVLL